MLKQEELKILQDNWKATHEKKGYKRFIYDGIVNEEVWNNHRGKKICYLLKEAYTDSENGYDLAKELREEDPWQMWRKVALWTQAIQNALSGNEQYYDHEELIKNQWSLTDEIAVVNIKKSNGVRSSDWNDIKKYAEEDKEYLLKELEIIDPDVIVCGYTLGLLKIMVGDSFDYEQFKDKMYGFWKDKLVIDYYHPANQYPNAVNYYALSSICRLAKEEWKF